MPSDKDDDEHAAADGWDATCGQPAVSPTTTINTESHRDVEPKRREGAFPTASSKSEMQAKPEPTKQPAPKFQAKFEREGGRRVPAQPRPVIHQNASLAQIKSGKYQINHVDPGIFEDPYVIPTVDFCCGAGGVAHGHVMKQGKFTMVQVLALDENAECCETHRLSHPEVPCVQHKIITWQEGSSTSKGCSGVLQHNGLYFSSLLVAYAA